MNNELAYQNNELVNPSKRQWFILVLCVVGGAIAPFFQYCHGTLTDYIMEKYEITYTLYASLNTAYAIACGVGLFIVGALSTKFGLKRWTMLGILLMIIGHGIFFFAPNYGVLMVARLISGFGNACIYNAAYTLAVLWFQGTNKVGVATGGMTAADGIGTFAALYIFSLLMSAMGISKGTVAVIIFMVVLFVILAIFLKDPENMEEAISDTPSANESGKYTKVLNRNTIAHSCAVAGVLGGLGIANYWGPTMLMEQGVSNSTAGFLSSMFTAVGIVSGIIFGAISDKMGTRKPPMLIGGIGMVAAYILMIFGNMWGSTAIFTFALIVCGFCGYVVYPIGFALIADTVSTKLVGVSNGVIQGSSFLFGMLVFQQIVGIVKDATDSYWIGLAFCAVLTLLLNVVAVCIFVKDKNKMERIGN